MRAAPRSIPPAVRSSLAVLLGVVTTKTGSCAFGHQPSDTIAPTGLARVVRRHAWFRPNASQPYTWEDGPGLLRSAGAVVALARLEAEEYNLPPEKIFLGGFDQVSKILTGTPIG